MNKFQIIENEVVFMGADKAPSDMSPDEFKAYTNDFLTLDRPIRNKVLLNAFGLIAVKGGIGTMMALGTANDKKHPLAILCQDYCGKYIDAPDAHNFIVNKQQTSVSSKINHTDTFTRVQNLGWEQEMVKLSAEVTPEIMAFVDRRPADEKERYAAFVSQKKEKPIMVVRKDGEIKGLGSLNEGNVSYSVNKTSMAPLEFDPYRPAHSAMATILARCVEITKEGEYKVNLSNDDYVNAMFLGPLFKSYVGFSQTVGLSGINLAKSLSKEVPFVKGKGIANEHYWYKVLVVATSPKTYDKCQGELDALVRSYNDFVPSGDMSIVIDKGLITMKLLLMDIAIPGGLNGRNYLGNADMKTAMDVLRIRRNLEGQNESGVSGLSLHYAYGVRLPKVVLDVVTLATDLRIFVRQHVGDTGVLGIISAGSIIDYEPYLLALRFLRFKGEVRIMDIDVGKVVKKSLGRRADSSTDYNSMVSGRFGFSDFVVRKIAPTPDIPTICVVRDYGIRHGDELSARQNAYNNVAKARDAHIEPFKVYLTNVFVPFDVSEGTYSSFETHNLMGWKTNSESVIKTLAQYAKMTADDEDIPYDYVQPVRNDSKGVAYSRCIVANLCRAQFPFTRIYVNDTYSSVGLIRLAPVRGNLSGIQPLSVTVDGVAIETVIRSKEVREAYLSHGSDEIKAIISQVDQGAVTATASSTALAGVASTNGNSVIMSKPTKRKEASGDSWD